jgi:hypothetical protein
MKAASSKRKLVLWKWYQVLLQVHHFLVLVESTSVHLAYYHHHHFGGFTVDIQDISLGNNSGAPFRKLA